MKKYIQHMRQQPPHERRQAAMRIASVITGVMFLGWAATLGVRLASSKDSIVAETNDVKTQIASVISAFQLPGAAQSSNTLEVATTSSYTAGQGNNY